MEDAAAAVKDALDAAVVIGDVDTDADDTAADVGGTALDVKAAGSEAAVIVVAEELFENGLNFVEV